MDLCTPPEDQDAFPRDAELYAVRLCVSCGERNTCWYCSHCDHFVCSECADWDGDSEDTPETNPALSFYCDVCTTKLEILLQ